MRTNIFVMTLAKFFPQWIISSFAGITIFW